MNEAIGVVVAKIDALTALNNADDLTRLQDLIDRYFSAPDAAHHLDVWFRLYERFPEDDGHGVFWSILHGIQAQPGCELLVVKSVLRRPSQFPVLMVNRLLNAGFCEVAGIELLSLLEAVTTDEDCVASARADARRFLEYRRSRI